MPIVDEKRKDSICGKATKGIEKRETGAFYEEKSIGKKVEEDRGRRGNMLLCHK